jgi:uncharacterized membrane protein YgcG
MKTLVVIILALGIGFAAAYVIVTKQKEAELAKLKAPAPTVTAPATPAEPTEKMVMAAPAAPTEESAADILNDLLNVKIGAGTDRNPALRQVVFKLEMLAQRGTAAVPAIRSFLGRNLDVSYSQDTAQNSNQPADANAATNNANGNNRGFNRGNNNNNGGGFGGRGGARRARNLENLKTDWVVPPSLRLGLIGILKEIGGAESEQALAEMLATTGRGVEVAYLTVMLEELAPGKYREAAVKAAMELLMSPPSLDNPDRLDELAKSYLYGVLEFYKDTSFAVNAQQMLVGADGRLDQDAMDYLSTVLKDQSVSALFAAYQNPGLTNQFDKMNVGREILNYAGKNSQANQLFTETLANPELDSRLKTMMVVQLAGADFGPFNSAMPTDPQMVGGRISLLNAAATQYANDQQMSQAIALATQALQNGTTLQQQDMQGIFGGGQGGGRRGGQGGQGGRRGGGGGNGG